MTKTFTYFKSITLIIAFLSLIHLNISAQIWDAKEIEFPVPSQGWRVRPVDDNVAWTFGYGIAPGAGGWSYTNSENTCQRTTDGGETWETKVFKPAEDNGGTIIDIKGVSADVAFVLYYNSSFFPILYRTTDGGDNWLSNNGGTDYYLNWVHFYDALNGISFGDPGDDGYFQVGITNDGGETWNRIDTTQAIKAEADEYGVGGDFAANGDHIYTSTYFRLLHSADRGHTWEVIDAPTEADGSLWGVITDDQNNLITIYNNFDNNLYKVFSRSYIDNVWSEITPIDNIGFVAGFSTIPGLSSMMLNKNVDFTDQNTFSTLASVDGGTIWNIVDSGNGYRSGFVEFSSPNTGYACEIPSSFENSSDNIFKYNGSPLSGLLSQNILDAEVEVYPNPTSDFLNVEVTSDKSNDYWILINDVDSKLIDKKIFTNRSSLDISLNINHLPAGEYLLTVTSKDGVATKKFVKK